MREGLPHDKVFSYAQGWGGSDYSKNIVVDEKQHPYTGTNFAWVRARCLGGKTNIWGRLALRMGDLDFKAKSHDGYGEDWPIGYADIAPVLRPGRSTARHLWRGRASAVPAGLDLPAALQAERAGGTPAQDAARHGPYRHALPGRRDHRRPGPQQVPHQVLRSRRLQPARRRMRHPRGVRFADGSDLPGAGHRPAPPPHQRHRTRHHR